MPTTTDLTESYIKEHASIKYCLKKGLINYSALSRMISKELSLEKKTTKEAILIASRRYKEKINVKQSELDIIRLFKNSNLDIKNNIVVYTIEKNIYPDALIDIERQIKKDHSLFFAIEGTKTITLIIQKQNKEDIEKAFKTKIIEKKETLSLITISGKGIGDTPGAVNFLSSQFFENSINIEEFMSCYDDTLIVIETQNLEKAIGFLNF
jgi:aspartokinase